MKEVTYEGCQKNLTPRMMWVWDNNEKDKVQRKVVYVLKAGYHAYSVLTVKDECMYETYCHCAEIEEPKIRRMAKKELSRWLREKPTREYKYITGSYIYASFDCRENTQDEELHESVRIRENDGEWGEPFVEIE